MTIQPFNLLDTLVGDRVLNAAAIAGLLAGTPQALSGTTLGLTDDQTSAKTLSTTNPATDRLIYGKLSFTYAGNVTVGSGTGSVAGVRGEVAGHSGTTLKDGFYYGVQGKFTLGGSTIQETSAARFCAVLAQTDVSSGTMTSGQLSALWADMGASAAGAFAPETNVIRASNTTAQSCNAILYGYGKASFGFDLSDNSGGWLSTTGSAGTTTAKGWIKVNINGSTRYIPLSDTGS